VQFIRQFSRTIEHVLRRWPMQWLAAVLSAVCVWVVFYTYQSSESMVRQYAVESAQTHADSVTQFRNFYTQELVPRAIKGGLAVTHDYQSSEKALPLPATLTIDLGHYLSRMDGGTQVNLYSDLPFPWRQAERQLDDFQRQALVHLKAHPNEPFVREEVMNGQRVLRFAQADRMLPRCVACHNSYPGSPFTQWKDGDVRGALEVVLPVSQWQTASTAVLNRTFLVLLALLFCGLFLIWLSVRRIRSALQTSRQLSADRQLAIRQLSQEITEREQAERQLRLSESKLSGIFKSVPEAIVVANAQGQILQCNAATEAIFGYPQQALMGQNIRLLMDEQDRRHHDGHLASYLKTGHKRLMNTPRVMLGRREDGSLFPVRLTISETRMDNEHVFIGVMQDFTAIQKAQDLLVEAKDKAEQANRMRGEFLANMSHEIRTPMNGIVGMTELALEQSTTPAQKEYLTLARDSAHHLLQIINEILDFSKIEAKALELQPELLSPAQLIRHTVRSLEPLARAKGIALNLVPDPAFPEWGRLDPVRVRQVLTNLIGNAIKFTTEGSVTVQTEALLVAHDEQTVMLRVSITDTGIGFDPSRTEALFSPFTQADGSVTRSFGGTGLGLAITRSLVQLMGGDVTAQGHPGQGACFVVNFPMEKATRELAHLMAQADVPLPVMPQSEVSPLKVLLVEDHDINRKLAEIMLQRMGCHYATAQDGQEALDRMAGEHFDVVLMDVMMPVMDGITALGHLREREAATGQHSVVLMVTAHAMTGDRERFLAAGADGYVSKPMSQTALQAEIDRVLAQRAAHASADAP
jgi:PAS domain S-box-containing protein